VLLWAVFLDLWPVLKCSGLITHSITESVALRQL